jgi:phosphoribosylamine---glycine ligase
LTILIIGSGAREHALAWRLAREPGVSRVTCAPGNPGIEAVATTRPVDAANPVAVADLAMREGAALTIIGPELPLSRGVADMLSARGLPALGPTQAAAALECSKAFAKAFMARHGVPTARSVTCESVVDARRVLAGGAFGLPVVLKADGLAAGKGVVVAATREEADAAVTAMMQERRFGEAGARLVIEECLVGQELSYFVLSDGAHVVPLGSAQDHKRAFDGDRGPNTGGMGAFAPSPVCTPEVEARILDEIVRPVINGMRAEGRPYRGFLYCGLMLTGDGPQVIEFNVRFGDPEAQVVLPLLEGDLVGAFRAATRGELSAPTVSVSTDRTVGVVLASGGYPDAFETGRIISGLDEAEGVEGVTVFHAGTARHDGQLVTAGGRVLTVVGRGPDYRTAMTRAYEAADRIRFEGMHLRRDIGARAVAHDAPGVG